VKDLSGGVLALAFLGALVLMFVIHAGYWYVAHQLAWWTFSLACVGGYVFWVFIKAIFGSTRNK
jgi:hypothetical protein